MIDEPSSLAETLAARGIERVAVRSSAAGEDGGRHSFAGVHETELAVPIARLGDAIARVAASPLAERAIAYRTQRGLPAPDGPCTVVVQEMVDAEWSGVAFGKGDGVLIEAVEGLGEAAVNGDATPEQIELVREGGTFRVTRRWPRKQPFAVRPSRTGTVRLALAGDRPELPEAVALELARGVAVLERARGMALDVEWAAQGGRIAFLQARPQTRPLEATLPPGETWTRTNIRELIPEIANALGASAIFDAFGSYMHRIHRELGVPLPDGVPVLAVVAGRAVANERMFCALADELGVSREWMQVLQGGAGTGGNAFVQTDWRKLLRRLDVVFRMIRFGAGAEKKVHRVLAERRGRREARAAAPPERLADSEIVARVRRATGAELEEILDAVMRAVTPFNQAVSMGAAVLARHPAPAALLARLVDPEQVSVSTRQLEELIELARALRGWEGAAALFREAGADLSARSHWIRVLPPELWSRVAAWLESYGHRCPYESDLSLPRTSEDLSLLAGALSPLVLAGEPPEPIELRRARRRADAEAGWREVRERCGRLAVLRARGPARALSRLMCLREEIRFEWMRDWALARRDLLELGRRLVERGRLDAVDEMFHLTLDELERSLGDPAFDARAAVARQRARVAAWRWIEVPNRFTSEGVAAFLRRGPSSAHSETLLRGTAVSPGEVEGRACVLRAPHDEAKMARGGILVAPATDPGWTPLFARAAGVVVEIGGVMSHAATVAREYGLPCVSNVEEAVARLRDGDLVRVDGTHGTIEILERAPD
ncbi:MAG TPA: PEP/pyruvate-binding domain-containing protein [Anaeromyxobacteraceae bacterium]|nr:PEP/pyruvate-binding domain-containing protein [Anaeromyxobacteraceae bacterium]